MQCVILAAGLGKRMRPLTDARPKPLIVVSGQPLLWHIVNALPSAVDEIILVIGYKGDMIREYCGEEFLGRKVRYIEQVEQNGTAHALWLCKELLQGRFMVLLGDDIHGKDDLARAVSYSRSILAATSATPERFGVIVRNSDGTLAEIIEKPEHPPSNLVSTGSMVLDADVFKYEPQNPVNGEFYLPEVVERYAKDHPVVVVEQHLWIPIGYPEDVEKAEKILAIQS